MSLLGMVHLLMDENFPPPRPSILFILAMVITLTTATTVTLRGLQEIVWLFTLFLLLIPFQKGKRRLTVKALIEARLSLVSASWWLRG